MLALPAPANSDKPGIDGGIRTAAAQLRGDGPPVDFVQDYYGARRLVRGENPYETVGRAFASVGIKRRANHLSTHPPSAFVLAVPVSWLSWRVATAVWAWLMLGAIAGAFWALGARPEVAVAAAPLSLVWPPAAWSLGQLTPLWLLGLAIAWRFRERGARAGAGIALASLTKLVPGISLLPFLGLRRWGALLGFAIVWLGALAVVLGVRAVTLIDYVRLEPDAADAQAARRENSALVWYADHRFGIVGGLAALALVVAVLELSLRRISAHRSIDAQSWAAWTWAGVALLPIAWIYSLLPLLPGLMRSLRGDAILAWPAAAAALVIPFAIDPFGLPGGMWLAVATASAGVALLLQQRSRG